MAVSRLSQPVLSQLEVLSSCNSLKHITETLKLIFVHLLAYDLQSKHYLKISAVKKKKSHPAYSSHLNIV